MENDETFDKRWFAWQRKYDPQPGFVDYVYTNGSNLLSRWNTDVLTDCRDYSVSLLQTWMNERYLEWREGSTWWAV